VTISANSSGLRQMRWHELLARFMFGGAMTVIAGLIAQRFGPVIGGLFLAFPAIFPASATLIDKHEIQKKQREGVPPQLRGRHAAGADAMGTALGSIGLAIFAAVVWLVLPSAPAWLALTAALLAWAVGAVTAWAIWKKRLWRFLQPSR